MQSSSVHKSKLLYTWVCASASAVCALRGLFIVCWWVDYGIFLHITGLDSPIGLKCKNATNRICCAGPKNRFCCSFTVIREHCQYYSLPLHPTNEPRPYGLFILCIWTGNRKYSETSLFIYCLSKLNQTRLSTFSLYFFILKCDI